MDYQNNASALWTLIRCQHGVISRGQMLEAGLHPQAIKHRVRSGRLHRKARGVYAVGRAEITRLGELMVAVLACGERAVISHETAAELWGVRRPVRGPIEVSLPSRSPRRRPGLRVHSRLALTEEMTTTHQDVPVTTLPLVMVDMALRWSERHLEAALNQADALDLVDPEAMRAAIEELAPLPGVRRVRDLLDRHTFRLTDSELERRFLRIVRRAQLPLPLTQRFTNGHRVDFVWGDQGVVAETDSFRYHRTASQQNRDVRRDHDHLSNRITSVRFTHYQVRFEPDYVLSKLNDAFAVAAALRAGAAQ